ncbi:MAG: hypothetical protein RJA70_3694, partial [Pseudomonadota bacterium]
MKFLGLGIAALTLIGCDAGRS